MPADKPRWRRKPDERPDEILKAAFKVFSERGFAHATMDDVAEAAGITKGTIYLYFPGKEELFIEVVQRSLDRHRRGLRDRIAAVPARLRDRLHAVAEWFLNQSPMDLVRMTQSDIPALSSEAASRLEQLAYESILRPVEHVLRDAHEAGETLSDEFGLVAGGLVGMIQSLFSVPEYAVQESRAAMGRRLVDYVIDGIAAPVSPN